MVITAQGATAVGAHFAVGSQIMAWKASVIPEVVSFQTGKTTDLIKAGRAWG